MEPNEGRLGQPRDDADVHANSEEPFVGALPPADSSTYVLLSVTTRT
jgi:hypothetical protein